MIGVNYRVLKDFGELGIDEVSNIFIKDTDLKKLVSDEFIINYMSNYLKNNFSIIYTEDLIYLGKDSENGRFVFEILGKKSTANNIRRHEVLYIVFEPSVEVVNNSVKSYIRLNTDDFKNYINPFIIE